jgi:hypothetical protein
MSAGIVPSHIDSLMRVLGQKRFQEFGNFASAFMAARYHDGFAGVPIDRA